MEWVLFLLAGFLSLMEGQSELVCLMVVTSDSILVTDLAVTCWYHMSIMILILNYPVFSLPLVCNLDPVPFDCQEAYVLGCRQSECTP